MLSAAESPSGRRLIANGASGPAGGAGRLVNASVRARTGTGEESLIAGFVVAGPGTKPMLIRAVGPTLAILGVKQPLGDPRLELHDLRRGSIIAQSAA